MPPDSTEQNGNECWVGYSIDDLLAGAAADKFASEESSEAVKYFAQRVRINKGIYPAEKQAASRKILKPFQSGDVLYFPGCVTKAHFPATVAGMVTIAEKAGARLMTDSDQQVCCGAPSIFAGDLNTARELVQHNYEYIQNSGAELVVCDCPECTRVLRQAYPRLDFALSQPVLHASEWIWSLLESGAISFAFPPLDQEGTPSVAYYAPCILAKSLGVIQPPRRILQELYPNIMFQESRDGEAFSPCGYCGLADVVSPGSGAKTAHTFLDYFATAGAKNIVTACPTCQLGFQKSDPDGEFTVKNIIEVVGSAL